MFARGSRYRNLPQSTSVDVDGARRLGTDLRFIPRTTGQFLHTVNNHDRLDLLAFKYYNDSTRWWQVTDANPAFPFPLDLLGQSPLVDERLALVDPDSASRSQSLLAAVNALGQVRAESGTFVRSRIIAVFVAAAVRQQIISAIGSHGFHFLRSFSWPVAGGTAEEFMLEDRQLKASWRAMLEDLRVLPGVIELQSMLNDAAIHIVYNNAMLDRGAILSTLSRNGFAVSGPSSQQAQQVGATIIIPPNGTT